MLIYIHINIIYIYIIRKLYRDGGYKSFPKPQPSRQSIWFSCASFSLPLVLADQSGPWLWRCLLTWNSNQYCLHDRLIWPFI